MLRVNPYGATLLNVMKRSPRCQMAISYAEQACRRLVHLRVTSAHLVLGLLTLHGGVGGTVLKRAGLSNESVERYLSSKRIANEEAIEQEGALFGKSATAALTRAEREAAACGHAILGVEQAAASRS